MARCALFFAVTANLAAPGFAVAEPRRADPPVRQPMLIQPIPESELRPAAPRVRAEPAPTRRPATPVPGQDRFYDASVPSLPRLQKANEALAGFPVDRAGFVDWAGALGERLIAPRAGVGPVPDPTPHDLDVVMRNTKEMPWVRFPHLAHSRWLDCANCHPAPFAEKAGAAAITMERIFRGEACGICHGKVAFPAWNQCERCHSVASAGKAGAGAGGR